MMGTTAPSGAVHAVELVALATSCAPPSTEPHAMTAAQHEAAATDEDRTAARAIEAPFSKLRRSVPSRSGPHGRAAAAAGELPPRAKRRARPRGARRAGLPARRARRTNASLRADHGEGLVVAVTSDDPDTVRDLLRGAERPAALRKTAR